MNSEHESGLSLSRLEALTDGIYAIAMTLLVLNLIIPTVPESEAAQKIPIILTQDWQKFVNYVVSFILLSVYWMIHHMQSRQFTRTDTNHVWINIYTLMFVVLIPFSFSLVSDYPSLQITNLVFQCNLCVVGLLTYANWAYATHDHRLVDASMSPEYIAVGKRRSLMIPVLSVLAALATYVSPDHSNMVYLLSIFAKPALSKTKQGAA